MKNSFVHRMVRCAAVVCVALMAARAEAVVEVIMPGVVTNDDNEPYFVTGGTAGFVGTATDKVDSTSSVTGTAIELAGTSNLPDLSDGNGLPLGIRFTYDLNFTVQSTSANSTLSHGGTNGLAVFTTGEGATARNRLNPAQSGR